MKNAKGDGSTIEFTAGAALTSGDPILIGVSLVGIVVDTVANGAQAVARVEGVFEVPCLTTDVIAAGDSLWWDVSAGEFTKTATGNIYGGKAWNAAGNGVVVVDIKLAGDKVVA